MRQHKTVVRLLIRRQVLFQPLYLLRPERIARDLAGGHVADVAIDHGKMRIAPIEGIIGQTGLEEIVKLFAIALVIAQGWEECRLPQQVALDVEEVGPEGGVFAVFHQIAAVQHEVGHAAREDARDHAAVNVMARADVAIEDEVKGLDARRRRLEPTLDFPAGVVIVARVRLQTGQTGVLHPENGRRLSGGARAVKRQLAVLHDPGHRRTARGRIHNKGAAHHFRACAERSGAKQGETPNTNFGHLQSVSGAFERMMTIRLIGAQRLYRRHP